MRRVGFAGAVAAMTLLIGCLTEAQAGWQICNKTPENKRVAIAYVTNDGIISEGWWTLGPCGGCKTVLMPSDASDQKNVFIYSQGAGGTIEGDDRYCVKDSSFRMNATGNCRARKGFSQVKINLADWTTTITGKSASGAVCRD